MYNLFIMYLCLYNVLINELIHCMYLFIYLLIPRGGLEIITTTSY